MQRLPIKRNENLVELSRDHHLTLLFCWKIRSGLKLNVEPARMIDYVQYFWKTHMQPHFAAEESILFAAIANKAVEKAENDHAQISWLINNLGASRSPSAEKLTSLANLVDDHVRYEERELFPLLEKELTSDNLKKIGKQLAEKHDPTLKDDYADEFWLNK